MRRVAEVLPRDSGLTQGSCVFRWAVAIRIGEAMMKLQLKRVYESPADIDGPRILVDRLWPRGLSKAEAKIDFWAKDVAPSNELRRWYQHEQQKWPEFQHKYLANYREILVRYRNLSPKLGMAMPLCCLAQRRPVSIMLRF